MTTSDRCHQRGGCARDSSRGRRDGAELPSGSVLVELDVTTRGDGGSSSVPVVWFEPGALAESLQRGRCRARRRHVRRRFFRAGGGHPEPYRGRRPARRAAGHGGRRSPVPSTRWPRRSSATADGSDTSASAHGEPGCPGRRLTRDDVDAGHLGRRWTDRGTRRRLWRRPPRGPEHCLHRPVGAVADPAGEAELDGVAPARLAEPHALDAAADDDAVADALGHRVESDGAIRPSCRIAPVTTPQSRVISLGSMMPLPLVSVAPAGEERSSSAAHVSSSTAPSDGEFLVGLERPHGVEGLVAEQAVDGADARTRASAAPTAGRRSPGRRRSARAGTHRSR